MEKLGTRLRHLIDLLDSAVASTYTEAGLRYRPRYTPIVRALTESEPLTINQIAKLAGITQPAATQTIALMVKDDIVKVNSESKDGRHKFVRFTDHGRAMLPLLTAHWDATTEAIKELESELPHSLTEIIKAATSRLEEKPFAARLKEAHQKKIGR
ncbi:MarR family winged helix-turn-helix transcriptional regulator [Undibacterium baiyunense]|uniref:MarR family transcriptional regulator n=1 Tax=Undibacterium baiyunense TaxID=2828731 RepID=A0A941DE78_9BURK|nr:MarR family transcriptional regulator [Undibacterium baiyunense]MBR7746371.1 MarR family transcriptional regulator [Undibacterium baiyunense]